jgi:hypothetical protein
MSLPSPQLKFFADLSVQVGAPLEVGDTGRGRRRFIPITGGEAQGEGWRARVLPGGADYQLVASDTLALLEAHYVLELEGGGLVYVRNQAMRAASAEVTAQLIRGEPVDPAQVYFRCVPAIETAVPSLAWTRERLFVGTGQRHPDRVVMRFYELA